MLTLIISIVVMALIPVIFVREDYWLLKVFYILMCAIIGFLIGGLASQLIPAKYEVKTQSYNIVSSGDLMQIQKNDITFSCEENGKITRRKISADFIEIIYTSDKVYYLVETNFKNTNKFSLQKDKTNVRVFIYNPHQWCGFF